MSLASFLMGDNYTALKTAQKAVHCYPSIAENWAMLLSVLSKQRSSIKLVKLSDFVLNNLKCTSVLANWLRGFK